MKEEILEEAAKRILSKEGVKLHPSGLETYLKGNAINAMVEIAKWQQERMYEIMDAYADDVMGGCTLRAKEWFEQFK
jgi:hypothetical protein